MLETGEAIRLKAAKISDLNKVAETILDLGKEFTIWLFEGEMGSGKTTLIRMICEKMGVLDNVNSPSFGLVNEYLKKNGETVFHFDFYRIEQESEAVKIGVDEYFDSGFLCMIEWPEKIASLLPEKFLKIELKLTEKQHREITLQKYE